MNGVTFGSLHSYNDLDLILNIKTIGKATPKIATVDIPGGDGELDCTEYFGDVKYYNRELTFEFSATKEPKRFLALYSRLQNLLNGRKMKITLDDDPGFYYVGRVTIDDWQTCKRIGKIVINVNAEPYKLKQTKTVISRVVTGTQSINCVNNRKQTIPKITASSEINVAFGEYSVMFTGERTDEEIIFTQGQNILTVTATNNNTFVTIEYQEGEL